MIRVHMRKPTKARHKARHGKSVKAPVLHHHQPSAGQQARRNETRDLHLGALARKK